LAAVAARRQGAAAEHLAVACIAHGGEALGRRWRLGSATVGNRHQTVGVGTVVAAVGRRGLTRIAVRSSSTLRGRLSTHPNHHAASVISTRDRYGRPASLFQDTSQRSRMRSHGWPSAGRATGRACQPRPRG